jgi:hypothetical protein
MGYESYDDHMEQARREYFGGVFPSDRVLSCMHFAQLQA